MSVSDALGVRTSDLDRRLKIVNILPAATFTALVTVLVLAGAPREAPDWDRFRSSAQALGIEGALALTALVTAVSVALQPFELAIIRLLEGYWPERGPLGVLRAHAVWFKRRKLRGLLHLTRAAGVDASDARVQAARTQLAHWPLRLDDVLPTTLGNSLRAMERRAGRAYAMDAVTMFPRLSYTLPESALQVLENERNQLDASVRFCLLALGTAVVTVGLLIRHPVWLLLPVALLLIAALAYAAAVQAARNYGVAIAAAFDVYHLRLLDDMGVRRPATTEEFRAVARALDGLIKRLAGASVTYVPLGEPDAWGGGAAPGASTPGAPAADDDPASAG